MTPAVSTWPCTSSRPRWTWSRTRRHDGYRVLEGRAHTALAAVELAASRPEPAIDHARLALTLHRETGHRLGEAYAHRPLVDAYPHTGRTDRGLEHHQLALTLYTDIGITEGSQGYAVV